MVKVPQIPGMISQGQLCIDTLGHLCVRVHAGACTLILSCYLCVRVPDREDATPGMISHGQLCMDTLGHLCVWVCGCVCVRACGCMDTDIVMLFVCQGTRPGGRHSWDDLTRTAVRGHTGTSVRGKHWPLQLSPHRRKPGENALLY